MKLNLEQKFVYQIQLSRIPQKMSRGQTYEIAVVGDILSKVSGMEGVKMNPSGVL